MIPKAMDPACCQVPQTMLIGPPVGSPLAAYREQWDERTPLEFSIANCGPGLLSLNYLSFVSADGTYTGPLRSIELFLCRSNADPRSRVDSVQIPIFKGTVALYRETFPGGFPVPLDTSGTARFALRTRVDRSAGGARWNITAGLFEALQNRF